MSKILRNRKYIALIICFALGISIAAGYMIVRARNNEKAANRILLLRRDAEKMKVYIAERKQELQQRAAESPDSIEVGLVILNDYTSVADAANLCEAYDITLDLLEEIFITDGNIRGGARFDDDSVANLKERGIESIREFLGNMTETQKDGTTRVIEMQQGLIESGEGDNTKDALNAKQAYRNSILELQQYQKQLDRLGVPVYAIKFRGELAVLQELAEDSLVRVVDLQGDGALVGVWDM